MTTERKIELALIKGVQALGGEAIKLIGTKGIPDRLVIFPGGQVWFIELKRPGGIVSAMQNFWLEKLEKLGCKKCVLSSELEVWRWLYALHR